MVAAKIDYFLLSTKAPIKIIVQFEKHKKDKNWW